MERLGQQLKTFSESVTTTFPQFYSYFNFQKRGIRGSFDRPLDPDKI